MSHAEFSLQAIELDTPLDHPESISPADNSNRLIASVLQELIDYSAQPQIPIVHAEPTQTAITSSNINTLVYNFHCDTDNLTFDFDGIVEEPTAVAPTYPTRHLEEDYDVETQHVPQRTLELRKVSGSSNSNRQTTTPSVIVQLDTQSPQPLSVLPKIYTAPDLRDTDIELLHQRAQQLLNQTTVDTRIVQPIITPQTYQSPSDPISLLPILKNDLKQSLEGITQSVSGLSTNTHTTVAPLDNIITPYKPNEKRFTQIQAPITPAQIIFGGITGLTIAGIAVFLSRKPQRVNNTFTKSISPEALVHKASIDGQEFRKSIQETRISYEPILHENPLHNPFISFPLLAITGISVWKLVFGPRISKKFFVSQSLQSLPTISLEPPVETKLDISAIIDQATLLSQLLSESQNHQSQLQSLFTIWIHRLSAFLSSTTSTVLTESGIYQLKSVLLDIAKIFKDPTAKDIFLKELSDAMRQAIYQLGVLIYPETTIVPALHTSTVPDFNNQVMRITDDKNGQDDQPSGYFRVLRKLINREQAESKKRRKNIWNLTSPHRYIPTNLKQYLCIIRNWLTSKNDLVGGIIEEEVLLEKLQRFNTLPSDFYKTDCFTDFYFERIYGYTYFHHELDTPKTYEDINTALDILEAILSINTLTPEAYLNFFFFISNIKALTGLAENLDKRVDFIKLCTVIDTLPQEYRTKKFIIDLRNHIPLSMNGVDISISQIVQFLEFIRDNCRHNDTEREASTSQLWLSYCAYITVQNLLLQPGFEYFQDPSTIHQMHQRYPLHFMQKLFSDILFDAQIKSIFVWPVHVTKDYILHQLDRSLLLTPHKSHEETRNNLLEMELKAILCNRKLEIADEMDWVQSADPQFVYRKLSIYHSVYNLFTRSLKEMSEYPKNGFAAHIGGVRNRARLALASQLDINNTTTEDIITRQKILGWVEGYNGIVKYTAACNDYYGEATCGKHVQFDDVYEDPKPEIQIPVNIGELLSAEMEMVVDEFVRLSSEFFIGSELRGGKPFREFTDLLEQISFIKYEYSDRLPPEFLSFHAISQLKKVMYTKLLSELYAKIEAIYNRPGNSSIRRQMSAILHEIDMQSLTLDQAYILYLQIQTLSLYETFSINLHNAFVPDLRIVSINIIEEMKSRVALCNSIMHIMSGVIFPTDSFLDIQLTRMGGFTPHIDQIHREEMKGNFNSLLNPLLSMDDVYRIYIYFVIQLLKPHYEMVAYLTSNEYQVTEWTLSGMSTIEDTPSLEYMAVKINVYMSLLNLVSGRSAVGDTRLREKIDLLASQWLLQIMDYTPDDLTHGKIYTTGMDLWIQQGMATNQDMLVVSRYVNKYILNRHENAHQVYSLPDSFIEH
jgi:hypothetical protein